MYPFTLTKYFKKISILVAIPYVILCITSGGLHSLDKRAYHGHNLDNYISKNNETHKHNKHVNTNGVSFCFNDHSADNCGICKWLKNTTKKVQFAQKYTSLSQDSSKLCVFYQSIYDFLKFHTNSPRSPPFSIS